MRILSGVSDFFGLDIGTSALRAVQLKGTGTSRALVSYGQLRASGTTTVSDSPTDRQATAQMVKELIKQTGIGTKNVAVNIPSQRVFTTIVDMDRLSPADLAKTIRYQAESFIPTPLAESKIDWSIIGDSPKDPKKIEVLLSSAPNSFVEARLDMLESIGLNVIAIEPDSLAITRSMAATGAEGPQMILDVGNSYADLVIVISGVPRLTRAIAYGSQSLIRAVSQNLSIDSKEASQFVFKFGLGKDKLEGKIYNAIINTVENLMGEIDKSIKFFESRYSNQRLERIIVTGGASTLPEFPLFLANRFSINVEIGNAWRNISTPPSKQNELMAVANHFAVAAGLAERDV